MSARLAPAPERPVHCLPSEVARTQARFGSISTFYPDGTEPVSIWCRDGFVSRCVGAVVHENIPDAIRLAEILNAREARS